MAIRFVLQESGNKMCFRRGQTAMNLKLESEPPRVSFGDKPSELKLEPYFEMAFAEIT